MAEYAWNFRHEPALTPYEEPCRSLVVKKVKQRAPSIFKRSTNQSTKTSERDGTTMTQSRRHLYLFSSIRSASVIGHLMQAEGDRNAWLVC